MKQQSFNYKTSVGSQWIDYNGHMTDSAYSEVFSYSLDAFMSYIELDEKNRKELNYTIFTMETHLCHLLEANEGEPLNIIGQILDVSDKLLHVFFTMQNSNGESVATSEQMLMGIDTKTRKSASFPAKVAKNIEQIWETDKQLEKPRQAGQRVGIRRK